MSIHRIETKMTPMTSEAPPRSFQDKASEQDETGQEILETDIVFDCPHCGKSLAIDYRGAGLIVNCSDCGAPTEVPIPEGLELDDLDQDPETLELRIAHLRQTVVKLGDQVREQGGVIQGLKERRAELEKARGEQLHRLAEIRTACETIQRSQLELSANIARIMDLIRGNAS